MKVKLISTLGIVCVAFLLVACAAPAPAPAPAAKPWPKLMTIAGGEEGTSGYAIAVGLAKEIEGKLGIPVTVSSAASAERARLVAQGAAEIGNPSDINLLWAMRGTESFQKEGKQPLRLLGFTYQLINLVMTRGIKSFPELKGKRAMFDSPGFPQLRAMADPLMKFYKMAPGDIDIKRVARMDEISEALIAGLVDAGIRSAPPAGTAALKELANKVDLTFLSLSEQELDFIRQESPFFAKYTLRPGVYRGQDYPVRTTAHGNALIVHKDLPEDLVYAIAKILMDSTDMNTPGLFTKYHPSGNWTLQNQIDLLSLKIAPFHPGVVRYLKDRGVWTPETDVAQAGMEAIAK